MRKINIHKIFDLLYEEDDTKSYTMEDATTRMLEMGYTTDEITNSIIGLKVRYYVDENDQVVGGAEILDEYDEMFEDISLVCRNCCTDIDPNNDIYYVIHDSISDNPENDIGIWCQECFDEEFTLSKDGNVRCTQK